MKVSAFLQAPYRHLPEGFEEKHPSVITVPYDEFVEPDKMHEAMYAQVEELLYASEAGFDGLALTEHSQSSYDMVPNPNLIGSILAYETEKHKRDQAIIVLGRSLAKTQEPLRIAEEYATIDAISNGRLIAGMNVGLAYDVVMNAAVPGVNRNRFYEAHDLIKKAWSEKDVFAWNGDHWKYRYVNPWPRPVQNPRPPIWMTGIGNPNTINWVLENDYCFSYLSWFGPKTTAPRIFERFWDIADKKGVALNPYRVAYLQIVAVSETDELAEKEYGPHIEYFYHKGLGAIPVDWLALPGYISKPGLEFILKDTGDFGLYPQAQQLKYKDFIESQCVIAGSPATVREQLAEFVKKYRIGNLLVMLQFGSMPTELTKKNIDLFSKEVMPYLKNIWADEDWEHEWWPQMSYSLNK